MLNLFVMQAQNKTQWSCKVTKLRRPSKFHGDKGVLCCAQSKTQTTAMEQH